MVSPQSPLLQSGPRGGELGGLSSTQASGGYTEVHTCVCVCAHVYARARVLFCVSVHVGG